MLWRVPKLHIERSILSTSTLQDFLDDIWILNRRDDAHRSATFLALLYFDRKYALEFLRPGHRLAFGIQGNGARLCSADKMLTEWMSKASLIVICRKSKLYAKHDTRYCCRRISSDSEST